MTRAIAALCVTLLSSGVAMAQDRSPTEGAIEALSKVCQPALENEIAPRISAEKVGMTRDATPPSSVAMQFPVTALGSASYSAPVAGGRVHVVSTVMPPPASPYSCVVALDLDAPDLIEKVRAGWTGPGSRYQIQPGRPDLQDKVDQIVLNAVDPKTGAVDKIIALRLREPLENKMRSMILTYRVDASSMRAAGAK